MPHAEAAPDKGIMVGYLKTLVAAGVVGVGVVGLGVVAVGVVGLGVVAVGVVAVGVVGAGAAQPKTPTSRPRTSKTLNPTHNLPFLIFLNSSFSLF